MADWITEQIRKDVLATSRRYSGNGDFIFLLSVLDDAENEILRLQEFEKTALPSIKRNAYMAGWNAAYEQFRKANQDAIWDAVNKAREIGWELAQYLFGKVEG